MKSKKEILRDLSKSRIQFVIIGGVALQIYNSPRLTVDIDVAIRVLDVDEVISLMYKNGFFMIAGITEDKAFIALSASDAQSMIESLKSGSMTFVCLKNKPQGSIISFPEIDISTQFDFISELCIPFVKLLNNARKFVIDDFSILVASLEDLLELKRNRKDKSSADDADIKYLEEMIEKKKSD